MPDTEVASNRGPFRRLKRRLVQLYEGDTPEAHRFRYALFVVDIVVILFIVVTSFMARNWVITALDIACGLIVAADFLARLWIAPSKLGAIRHWSTLVDFVAILSFLAPLGGEGAGFLRVLRTLRLLHTYQVLQRLRADSAYFRRNEEIILAGTHLAVFVFVMTAIVYETQHYTNPHITNYADALYFTVTALTTTGFGDITLPGTVGRMLSVIIMLFGVTLFLRLAQVLFRPSKVRFPCPVCGLQRHEHDAIHCKACGTQLNIPDEGD